MAKRRHAHGGTKQAPAQPLTAAQAERQSCPTQASKKYGPLVVSTVLTKKFTFILSRLQVGEDVSHNFDQDSFSNQYSLHQ